MGAERDEREARDPRQRLRERPSRLDDVPDVRDGLTRKERVVLWVLGECQKERDGRNIAMPMLYGRVIEHVDMSIGELQAIVERLGARR
jgi:hypothetical protein